MTRILEKVQIKTKELRFSSVGWHLHVLQRWMDGKMIEKLNPFGLSLDQYKIMMILFAQDGLTQVEICKNSMLPAYTTTRILDKLQNMGYVLRQVHETSRRCHRIVLTQKGRAIAPALHKASSEVHEAFFAPLEEYQKVELLETLSVLSEKHT